MKIRSPWLSLCRLPVSLLTFLSLVVVVTGCQNAIPGQPPPAPIVNIVASPTAVAKGSTSMLSVAASNATQVTVTGSDGSSYTLPADGGNLPVNPTTTTTYTVAATGPGGTTTASSTISVTAATAPTINILASPMSITSGSSSTLTVTATNATSVNVTGSDGSSYALQAAGGTQSVSPATTTTYTATATGAGGTITATATVTVGSSTNPAPTVAIAANPASITSGGSSTLTVTATNATSVSVTGNDGSSYMLAATGGTQSVSPTTTTAYTATATGDGGKISATTTVTVGASTTPPPTVTIAANPNAITSGGSSALTVAATNATSLTITGSDGSSYTVSSAGGTQSVSPKATTTYTATATGSGGKTSANATVTVTSPAPTVHIAASPTSITSGSSSTLTVTATNATGVTITGTDGSSYTLSSNGGAQTVEPTATTTYTATATGAGGKISASTTVNVTAAAPVVTFAASAATITAGSSTTLTVTATHATGVTITGSDGSSYTLGATGGTQSVSPTKTTTYTATATGSGGKSTKTTTITVTQKPAPTVAITANPTSVTAGSSSTLTVTATNATGVTLTGTNGSNRTLAATGGAVSVSPTSTTTYTATATGAGGTTSSKSVTITVISSGFQLTVTSAGTGTGTVTSTPAGINCPGSCTASLPKGTAVVLVAAAQAGATFAGWSGPCTGVGKCSLTLGANTTVTPTFEQGTAGITSIKHIIVFAQENRSLDNYFGAMREYWKENGIPDQSFDGLPQFNPTSGQAPLYGPPPAIPGCDPTSPYPGKCIWDPSNTVASFHMISVCNENTSPSWQEAHIDWNYQDQVGKYPAKNNGFVHTAAGDARDNPGKAFYDTDGIRAMGYWDGTDMNYDYFMASNFATSDRFFQPVMSRTELNREYLDGATTQGYVLPNGSNANDMAQLKAQPIFEELQNAGISWKVYINPDGTGCAGPPYDVSCLLRTIDLNGFTYSTLMKSKYPQNIAPISEYYSDLENGTLPQVAEIYAASDAGLDEHGSVSDAHATNVQAGARYTAKLVNALMNSSSWEDSALIFTFDESGGLYDHVAPQPTVNPDGIPPVDLPAGYICTGITGPTCDFVYTGYRIPLTVISPYAKKNYVSHTVMDSTAILKFIETRFNLPPLTKRDAAQPDMTEFFDFNNPPWMSPPVPPQQNMKNPCYLTKVP